mmetsp:Transcript_60600/g.161059  ORF Transcript_60600/g.161059 Transcript_60600/m.161059 type:complete len:98 (-) Transcript_60600:2-295(-)
MAFAAFMTLLTHLSDSGNDCTTCSRRSLRNKSSTSLSQRIVTLVTRLPPPSRAIRHVSHQSVETKRPNNFPFPFCTRSAAGAGGHDLTTQAQKRKVF